MFFTSVVRASLHKTAHGSHVHWTLDHQFPGWSIQFLRLGRPCVSCVFASRNVTSPGGWLSTQCHGTCPRTFSAAHRYLWPLLLLFWVHAGKHRFTLQSFLSFSWTFALGRKLVQLDSYDCTRFCRYDRKTLSCVWDRTADFSYSLFFSTVGVAFPVMLITICYIKIFLHVKASKVKVNKWITQFINFQATARPDNVFSSRIWRCFTFHRLRCSWVHSFQNCLLQVRQAKTVTASEKSAIREKSESVKLARTLCLIFVVFAVCWTPYAFIVSDFCFSFHCSSYLAIFHSLVWKPWCF